MTLKIPLCLRLRAVGGRLLPVVLSRLTNYVMNIVSIMLVTGLVKTSRRIVLSLTPGSIAAPVTVRMAGALNKVPSLATTMIIYINLLNTMLNFGAVGVVRMNDPVTRKLSVNATTRTINASATVSVDDGCNTCTDLNLALGNVFATLLAPAVLQLLKVLWRGDFVFIVCGRLGKGGGFVVTFESVAVRSGSAVATCAVGDYHHGYSLSFSGLYD